MITEVYLSEFLAKQIERNRIPAFVAKKLDQWLESIYKIGLERTRLIRGYHDEQLQGRL